MRYAAVAIGEISCDHALGILGNNRGERSGFLLMPTPFILTMLGIGPPLENSR